jgi:hypothetical protein
MVMVTTSVTILPGGPPISWLAAIIQAVKITKTGLRNSEGCTRRETQ